MTRWLIRSIMLNRRAQTMPEMLIAAFITVIFFTSALGVFVVARTMYVTGMAGQDLQRDVNAVVSTMVRGVTENNTKTGLRSATKYTLNSVTSISFDGPPPDSTTRQYYVGPGGIVYDSPKQSPNPQALYNTPANATLTLRFWDPFASDPDKKNETVGIYMSVKKLISGRNVSGSLTTYPPL